MNLRPQHHVSESRNGSVLVIVLLISIGLISIALYFANSMTLELRASDNRTSGLAADQAIEGAARYVSSILNTYATNGAMPDLTEYEAEAVPIGTATVPEENAHFWLIGRDPSGAAVTTSGPYFSLVDETSKLDLNAPWLTADLLSTNLSCMTADFATAILDWRDTNSTGNSSLNYSQSGYLAKHSAFETVGELRLVYGSSIDLLAGEDINRNGILDANESDANGNGEADPGALEYFTAYSRQPNMHSDGTMLTNVNQAGDLLPLLSTRLGATRAQTIVGTLFGGNGGTYTNLLQFFLTSGMTADEFSQIYNDITVTTNTPYATGRVNINTAPAAVLACLPGMNATLAQQLVGYRESNPTSLTSIAWVVDALGRAAARPLAQSDCITTHSYQFSADIAAVGPFGRGYRRVRFVFDISEGAPKIIYRQDLSRLGWAVGKQTRETWVTQNSR